MGEIYRRDTGWVPVREQDSTITKQYNILLKTLTKRFSSGTKHYRCTNSSIISKNIGICRGQIEFPDGKTWEQGLEVWTVLSF